MFANLHGDIEVAAAISSRLGPSRWPTSARTTLIVAGSLGLLVTVLTAWRLGRVGGGSVRG